MKKLLDGNNYSAKQGNIIKIISVLSFAITLFTTWFLYYDADLGLKVLWYAIIPLAPILFLLLPNIWTALCPLAFLQSIPKRLGINRDIYLNRRQSRWLNYLGIFLFYILIPARYIIFNVEGEISFYTLLSLLFLALIFGFFFTGLSGWCMGMCPIRPVELMYAQFNVEKKRPELCSSCDLCVANCPRLYTDEKNKIEKYNRDFSWFIYSFPGFILAFYLIQTDELFYYIYLKIYLFAIISALIFKLIERFSQKSDALYSSIILSAIVYYVNTLPNVADAWYINERYQSLLYIVPFLAILYAVLNSLPNERRFKFIFTLLSLSFVYFMASALFKEDAHDLNNFNWQEHAYKVGNKACISCHGDIVKEYVQSEMGDSFSLMSAKHTDLPIDSSHIYDSKSDFHYEIEARNGEYYMSEKRFDNQQKLIHHLEFKIDYVIGSGHNTKSFIMNKNGYLFEMPLTWYSKRKKWDLSPGYENYNIRFFRETTESCIDCHTEKTSFEAYSENRFHKVNMGIDCEKCHGPASLHIEQMKGKRKLAFNAILNPAKDQDQDDMVCYDCHGKKEVDFLEDFDDTAIGFTAHSTRLSLSKCFTETDMTCITCHDPHKKLSKTVDQLNKPCVSCHSAKLETIPKHKKDQNCVSCHMPKKGSSDIPHVNPTEHWIKVYDKNSSLYHEKLTKSYLDYVVPESHSRWEKKRAKEFLLRYRESIGSSNLRTDTLYLAYNLMKKQLLLSPQEKQLYGTILYFVKKYKEAIELFKELEKTDIELFEPNPDYYLFFAKSYFERKNYPYAERYYEKALKEYPNHIHTLMGLSELYIDSKRYMHALEYIKRILDLNPYYRDALYQKAFIEQFHLKKPKEALASYLKLIEFYPDDHDGILNLSFAYFENQDLNKSLLYLKRGLKRYPNSQKMLANLSRFSFQNNQMNDGLKYMNQLNSKYPQNPFKNALLQLYRSAKGPN